MMDTNEIISTFTTIINWASERSKYAKKYGTDELFYLAEIHAIQLIGNNPGIIMSELCEKLGVTKGRVSVLIKNIEKKGMVEKGRATQNKKEIPLKLTSKGAAVLTFHEKRELEVIKKVNSILSSLSEEETQKFNRVLVEVGKILRQFD